MDFTVPVGPFSKAMGRCKTAVSALGNTGFGSQHALCVADDANNTLTLSVTGLSGHFSETISAHVNEPGACMFHANSFDKFCRLSYRKGTFIYDEVEVPGYEADGLHRRFQFPNDPTVFGPEHSVYYSKISGEDQLAIDSAHAVKPLNVEWEKAPAFTVPTSLFAQATNLFATAKTQGVKALQMQVHLDMDSCDEVWLSTTSGPVTAVFRAAAALDKIEDQLPIRAVCPWGPFSLLPSICSQTKEQTVDLSVAIGVGNRPAAVRVTGKGWTCYVETVSRQIEQSNPRVREAGRKLPVQATAVVDRQVDGIGVLTDILRQAEAFRAPGVALSVTNDEQPQLSIKASALIGRCDLLWPIQTLLAEQHTKGRPDIVLKPRTVRAAVDALADNDVTLSTIQFKFMAGSTSYDRDETVGLTLQTGSADGFSDSTLYLTGSSR